MEVKKLYPILLLISLFILISLISSACLPVDNLAEVLPSPTSITATTTATNTPTIVWFPPTCTNTPIPIPRKETTPTPNMQPSFGKMILFDNFSDPAHWLLPRTEQGIVLLGDQEIALSISSERGYIYSVRNNTTINDFYLEITASPSLCRGEDEYGILFRLSSPMDFYRFGFSCNGEARLDRIINNKATSPQPPLASGFIPPGAPSTSKMAIWAVGKEMQFYANDGFLFSIRDPSLLEGSIGLFARAAGADMVSINFSDLYIYHAP